MKINGYGTADIVKMYGSNAKGKEKVKAEKSAAVQGDTLQISPEARALQTFASALKNMPPVREEYVSRLKQQINSGAYKPDIEKIAEGIIKEGVLDEKL